MSVLTDEQEHARYAEKVAWFEEFDPSWFCSECQRLVEYAPYTLREYEGPCDHMSYCRRCVRDYTTGCESLVAHQQAGTL